MTPLIDRGIAGLGIAVAGGHFRLGAHGGADRARASPRRSAPRREIELPEPERVRAAAYVITASEGAALHLDRLRTRARGSIPAVRDRPSLRYDPGAARGRGTEIPPLSRVLEPFARRWCSAIAGVAHRASHRAKTFHSTASRSRCAPISVSTPSRPFIGLPVVAVGAARAFCPSGCRSSPHPGARTCAAVARTLSRWDCRSAAGAGHAIDHSAASSSRSTGRAPTARA